MWGIGEAVGWLWIGVMLVIILGNVALGIFAVWHSITLVFVIALIYAFVMFNDEWRGIFLVKMICYFFGVLIGGIILKG